MEPERWLAGQSDMLLPTSNLSVCEVVDATVAGGVEWTVSSARVRSSVGSRQSANGKGRKVWWRFGGLSDKPSSVPRGNSNISSGQQKPQETQDSFKDADQS
ncbi:hypothetical protein DVH24_002418 [Malus domestica]|uniref:Uncharacterized protein n=1 Tax=Malus domestica TaxID=3750 RepID=A0A498IGZ1_MALDO|nr:hypothetical protein DVH24_002418 [Malus domestica]